MALSPRLLADTTGVGAARKLRVTAASVALKSINGIFVAITAVDCSVRGRYGAISISYVRCIPLRVVLMLVSGDDGDIKYEAQLP